MTHEEVLAKIFSTFDEVYKDNYIPTNWISVKDRPPEVGQRVLILSLYGHVSDAVFNQYDDEHYFDSFGYELSDGYVTHWMPWPEEPKEEENADGA